MTEHFAISDATGAVQSIGRCPEGMAAWQSFPDGGACALISAELYAAAEMRMEDFRVIGGELVERETMAPIISADPMVADGETECTVSGLPDPCTVTIRGAVEAGPVEVVGGSLSLTCSTIGALRLTVEAAPAFKTWRGTINAA